MRSVLYTAGPRIDVLEARQEAIRVQLEDHNLWLAQRAYYVALLLKRPTEVYQVGRGPCHHIRSLVVAVHRSEQSLCCLGAARKSNAPVTGKMQGARGGRERVAGQGAPSIGGAGLGQGGRQVLTPSKGCWAGGS